MLVVSTSLGDNTMTQNWTYFWYTQFKEGQMSKTMKEQGLVPASWLCPHPHISCCGAVPGFQKYTKGSDSPSVYLNLTTEFFPHSQAEIKNNMELIRLAWDPDKIAGSAEDCHARCLPGMHGLVEKLLWQPALRNYYKGNWNLRGKITHYYFTLLYLSQGESNKHTQVNFY